MQTTNYIKLWVHEAAMMPSVSTHTATVVVLDRDLFRSLEVSITLLQKAGWTVDDLAEYRIIPAGEESSDAPDLIATARAEGFAYRIEEAPDDPKAPEAKHEFTDPSLSGVTNLLGI